MAWKVYVLTPGVAVLIAAAFQVPVTGGVLSDCDGNGGGVEPTQIGRFSGNALNWMLVVGVTLTVNTNGLAHWPAFGVKV